MSLAPSSPRLPSPPPPAEIQIGPKSPSMGPHATRQGQFMEQTAIDANAKRRIHPGTKSADMPAGPPLVPLHELDSAFQLQEHLAALHYHHTASNTLPITRETAKTIATPPPGIDKTLWLYELCRFLVGQCNSLIVGFLFDTPPCSAATCPEMRASEWQFLCAVHDTPKSCCAIDYCCHTLDWAANVVTNPKIFPSRFVVDAHDKTTAIKNLVNVFRRLHRIFAHAWFQHRGVFWSVEAQTGLYVFFKTVCDVYDLLPAENYKLPPEAEGLESSAGPGAGDADHRMTIAQHQNPQHQQPSAAPRQIVQRGELADGVGGPSDEAPTNRTNTRRHIKSSPSTGSAVTTVPEADEDDGGATADVTNRLRGMHISNTGAAAAVDEEMELSSIPVIVEHGPLEVPPPVRSSSVVPISGPGSFAAMRAAMPDVQAMDFAVAARLEEEMKAGARAEPELEPVPESPAAAQELPLVHAPKEPEPEPEPEPEKKHEAESEPAMEMSSEPEGPASLPPQIVEHALAHEPAVEQLHPQQLQPEKDEVETAHQKLEEETPAPAPAAAATTSPTAASASAATVPAATTDHPSSEAGESSTNSLETASDGGSVSVPTPPPSEGADEDDEDAEQGEEEPADSAAVVIVAPPVVDVVEIDEEEEADGEPDGEPEGEKKIESESGDGVVAEGEEKGGEKETKTE